MTENEDGKVPPVKEGDIVSAECISEGKRGDGIFKVDNFIVIVPETEVGQTYSIEITKVMERVSFGRIAED